MRTPTWLDKYPRVKALLQQDDEALDYPLPEDAAAHGWEVSTLPGMPADRPPLAGGMGTADEWVTGVRVVADGDTWRILGGPTPDDEPVVLTPAILEAAVRHSQGDKGA